MLKVTCDIEKPACVFEVNSELEVFGIPDYMKYQRESVILCILWFVSLSPVLGISNMS